MNDEELPPILQDFAITLRCAGFEPSTELLDQLGGVVDHYEQSRDQQIALEARIDELGKVNHHLFEIKTNVPRLRKSPQGMQQYIDGRYATLKQTQKGVKE
jgi:hypothetical protein